MAIEPAIFHDLVEGLMGRLGWEDAHFVGYSFGGATTATFAATHPGKVASMVLIAPAGLLRAGDLSELERSYLRGGEGLEEEAQRWVFKWLGGGPVPLDWKERVQRGEVVREAIQEWQITEHKGHVASVVGVIRDGGVFDKQAQFAKAARTGIRSLCILGELDPVCSVRDLADVGMLNVSVVPEVGHEVVREKVPEVARLIDGFWIEL